MLHEQTGPLTQATPQDEDVTEVSHASRKILIATSGALLFFIAWGAAAFCYEAIAEIEGIQDQRAGQVTNFYGWWMAIVFVFSVIKNQVDLRKDPARRVDPQDSFTTLLLGPSSNRRFLGLCTGVGAATLLTGAVLIAVASLSAVVVTPPAAWLIMMPASIFGAFAGSRLLADR